MNRVLSLVSPEPPPVYPIPTGHRLENHHFLAWHHHGWMQSEFRMIASPAVRGVALDLYCHAYANDPAGTLPTNPTVLARICLVTDAEWNRLMHEPVPPLYGWEPAVTDRGQRVLAHRFLTQVALDGWKSRAAALERREADRDRKRLDALPALMQRAGAPSGMINDAALVAQFDQFLVEYVDAPGRQRRAQIIRAALEAFEVRRAGQSDWITMLPNGRPS